ncbi:hypothetical protein PFLmoz3_05882 [Pseudomonas fluorescens]|uniref:Uncharacterized protein n=1 Tax=Pseudomonas fluorescens TaxID=294 RepID=A0A125QHH2_PSEFL|nr:hypothetical protein PFLmoz3_05882 [Pseudomonas fluorescens]
MPGFIGYLPARCKASGRLTPAACTRIRISPGPATGTSALRGCKTSGPPGVVISIRVISCGSVMEKFL